ncbi:MAG: chromophore lyase CpcT/CpeT [Planctomycetaceae bacterium]|jgi:CpeT protein|nr:chromophore lyase CpcT/CpeT [Phycisphaerales bacterium]MCE2653006.1 chromophore lyase CpcT/CpeT [Planctomycetaceae bacterium]
MTTHRVHSGLAVAFTAMGLLAGCSHSGPATDGSLAAGPCVMVPDGEMIPVPPVAGPVPMSRLVSLMAGHFSSAAQAQADPEFFDIHLHMASIWPELAGEDTHWLYVEQARGDMLSRPYRQRVYRLVRTGQDRFRSDVFILPGDAARFAGAFAKPELLSGVAPAQLSFREGCSLNLVATADGFVGATEGTGCASELRGASYATSEATIGPDGMVTWDRGYDKDGKQVWGAVKSGYRFLRVR